MAIDYENFYSYAQLLFTPDVFIVPSELRYFVKVALNWLFARDIRTRLFLPDYRALSLPGSTEWNSVCLGPAQGLVVGWGVSVGGMEQEQAACAHLSRACVSKSEDLRPCHGGVGTCCLSACLPLNSDLTSLWAPPAVP